VRLSGQNRSGLERAAGRPLVRPHQSCGQAAPLVLAAPAPTPQKRSAGDAVTAAPPLVATAEIGFLQPSFAVREEQLVFASRWPENLPSAQTLNAED